MGENLEYPLGLYVTHSCCCIVYGMGFKKERELSCYQAKHNIAFIKVGEVGIVIVYSGLSPINKNILRILKKFSEF